ncbi:MULTISPECIES: glycine--tRNA ligase subunit beta [unclassified Legionella]|uniref:glycine--tRNA ligase subunit beta n=1 Tax=unclassified Legionella TaxID=2622702 RepID=UPI001054C86B|nr:MULTISPECIES: glycine--tRNA ligase subunit beta [unclassified Legionella]MDI9819408.1 glycine--tRNA ligase subunit beta [Legionella sp. PL877]
MVNDFLFELGCEELPSGAVWPLAEALTSNLLALLDKAEIGYGKVKSFATPRRLAILITDMQENQPSQIVSRRGPALAAAYTAEGQPTPALSGFAKSCGAALEQLKISKTDKGEWLIYETCREGAKTKEVLPTFILQALHALPIAKPMRWGSGDAEFARPVHWAVMLWGEELIDGDIFGVKTGRYSYGHRFHHPQSIEIDKAQDYEPLLREAFVVADFAARRELIKEQVQKLAAENHAQAIMPDELVDEVTSIVEWPQALVANFEQEFLDVPPEALIASMQSHQKCFALQDKAGNLLPHFITVANISSSNPRQVVTGNEKVMRARLSDAAFFFHLDKKQPLSHHIAATENVVFQAKLGSLRDKAMRMQTLMSMLSTPFALNEQQAERAAELSKCDLMTGMVGEFPELQGLMGYYYALHDGESEEVALALREQYMPRFAGDKLPSSKLGLALSLADRIDTLTGIFAIGQKPTGVKDPFKLRRHALAVVRLLILTSAQFNLSTLITETLKVYGEQLPDNKPAIAELQPFILERMQSYYQGQGINSELFQAVRARQWDWLFDFDKRIKALAEFIHLPEAAALSAACKRVNNLLQQSEFTDSTSPVDENLLVEDAEKSLFMQLCMVEKTVEPFYAANDYKNTLTTLASMRESVDAFFEHVMVMVDDKALKANRLRLLIRLQTLLQGVADISLLQLNL